MDGGTVKRPTWLVEVYKVNFSMLIFLEILSFRNFKIVFKDIVEE